MSRIAGVAQAGQIALVNQMLDKMSLRGRDWREMRASQGTTFGATGLKIHLSERDEVKSTNFVRDRAGLGHFAQVEVRPGGFILTRDTVGIRPLYYGWTNDGTFCFASEVKGLLVAMHDIHEMPSGHS
ncbi:MAG TPA: hypothetical protein VLD65_06565, partial [Anaerolineales bacterium]|nr:hypothetical protein [Anaerolineales bacterium]